MIMRTTPYVGLRVDKNEYKHIWCGIAVLSAALGINTKTAENIFKHTTLRKYIKGITYKEMEHALAFRHVNFKSVGFPREASDCLTLKRWLKSRDLNCTYLVCITGHWVAFRGNHWVCNMNEKARLVSDCPYVRAKVRYTIQLVEDQS